MPAIAIQAAHPSSQSTPWLTAAALRTAHLHVITLRDTPRSIPWGASDGASAPKRYLLACVFRL